MGNLLDRGTISISLDRTTVLRGARFDGKVHLQINKPIKKAVVLKVALRPVERLRYSEGSGDSKETYHKSQDHGSVQVDLMENKEGLDVGDYEYSFWFSLATELPQTLTYTRRYFCHLEDVSVTVEYKVEATLWVRSYTTTNLLTSRTIHIPPRSPVVPAIQKGAWSFWRQQDVHKLGVFKRGKCKLIVDIPTRKLKYILLALHEDAILDQKTKDPTKQGSRLVGCRRFEASTYERTNPLELTLHLPITPNDIYQFGALLPTLTTHFLTINYSVVVECHFSMAPRVQVATTISIVWADYVVATIAAAS